MQILNRAVSGITAVTPAGWSVLGGTSFAAVALCSFMWTNEQKKQVELAKKALSLIQIDEASGKLISIDQKPLPTTLQEYRHQLAAIAQPARLEDTDLYYLSVHLDLGMKLLVRGATERANRYLQRNLSTTHEGKETDLGFMLKELGKVQASGFAKRVDGAAKPDATLREKLSPYREELFCALVAVPFYCAFVYFVGVKKQLFFES